MVQIIKTTHIDDKDASKTIEIMVCSSKNTAREIVLNEINKGFNGNYQSFVEAVEDLKDELFHVSFGTNEFIWNDNGKGEEYHIVKINTTDGIDTKFQMVY